MNKSRRGSLVVVPNRDYVVCRFVFCTGCRADLATTETLTRASRCRPPRWPGSDSGSPSAGPDRFPEPSPAPQV